MQARILPGRGKGGRSRTRIERHGGAFAGELFQRRAQALELVDDALHGQLRRVAFFHRRRDVDNAAPGEHAGRYFGARRGLEQHKLHEFLPAKAAHGTVRLVNDLFTIN